MHLSGYYTAAIVLFLLMNAVGGHAQEHDIVPADSGWVVIPIDSAYQPQDGPGNTITQDIITSETGTADTLIESDDSSGIIPSEEDPITRTDTLSSPLGKPGQEVILDSLVAFDTIAPPPDPLQRFIDSLASVEMMYDSALRDDPYNTKARLNRGRIRSWLRNYDSANADLRFVLDMEPENIEAMNALGYNYAWSGRYNEAESMFRRSLETAPDQVDAAKGLGYTALWRGDAGNAVEQFGSLANHSPEDPDIQVALGQAELQAGRTTQARNAFKRALTIDPARSDAREALQSTKLNPATELTAWLGNTWSVDIGNRQRSSRSGIRYAEVATSPVDNLRIWLQYDNGMTFDNVSFARGYREAPAYYVGGFLHYDENLTTRLEVGFRKMPGNEGQYLLRTEQVIGLDDGYSVKFGGWGTPLDDGPMEMILHAAVGMPINERLRIEPTLIYSRTGLPGEFQIRTMFAGEYSPPSKWQIGGAAVVGIAAVGPESTITTLWDAYLRITAPVGVYDRMHLLLRREAVRDFNSITVLAAGLTVVIGRP